jgi:hypothetical protein
MKAESYNGWSNYETWLVGLWIDNNEGDYNYWIETAEGIYKDAEADNVFTKEERATLDLSEQLKDAIEENSPAGVTGLYADLMTGALGKVDWREVASHIMDTIDKS